MKKKIRATKAAKVILPVKRAVVRNGKVTAIDVTLNERGSRYGKFSNHAIITQTLKRVIRGEPVRYDEYVSVRIALQEKWESLPANMQEALDMTMHKIGRILNGDHNYDDSWHDIGGYTGLVVKKLHGEDI